MLGGARHALACSGVKPPKCSSSWHCERRASNDAGFCYDPVRRSSAESEGVVCAHMPRVSKGIVEMGGRGLCWLEKGEGLLGLPQQL
jgi:hypothetical protein